MAQRIPGCHRVGCGVLRRAGPLRPRRARSRAHAIYHAVRAWLYAAHVKDLIGELPVPLLVAMALVGDPIAGSHRPASIRRPGRPSRRCWPHSVTASTSALLDRALVVAASIPDDWERSEALAALAERLAAADPPDATLIDKALAVAATIPKDWSRSQALAALAERLAVIDRALAAALIDQAVAVARTLPDDRRRSQALAAIAERLTGDHRADRPGGSGGRNHPRRREARRGTGRPRRTAGRRRPPGPRADRPGGSGGRNHPRRREAR